jgi:hypothetical protein
LLSSLRSSVAAFQERQDVAPAAAEVRRRLGGEAAQGLGHHADLVLEGVDARRRRGFEKRAISRRACSPSRVSCMWPSGSRLSDPAGAP